MPSQTATGLAGRPSLLPMVGWLALAWLLQGSPARANGPETSGSVAAGYSTFRDQLNVGLVYQGADLSGRVGQRIAVAGGAQLQWDVALGLGVMTTRSMPALDLHFEPVQLSVCLQRRIDEPVDRWADHELFQRIGLSNYTWRR